MTREEKIAILKDIIDGEIVHPQARKDIGAWAINELKQEPCTDAISRQYLLENCVVDKVTMPFVPVIKIKSAPSVIPQSRTEAISRQAVLNTLDTVDKILDEGRTVENYKALLKDCYEVLTPIIPQPKVGKWLIVDDCERFIAKCSECGRVEDSRMINNYPYCHCGAKMERE